MIYRPARFAWILMLMLSASACGKKDQSTSGDAQTPGLTGTLAEAARNAEAESRQAAAQARLAALPKPDTNRSLSDYAKLQDGTQIMFLYLAASKLPPDYEQVAETLSAEYRNSTDSFRKHDLLAALKPQIDQNLAVASQQPYAWMEVENSDNLASYDFKRGGFPVGEFLEENTRYFNDASSYRLKWVNRESVAFAPVKEEAVAREIEQMRASYNQRPHLKIYFFAQSVDLDNKVVKAYVTRVQITDRSGRVLSEYGPDGKVVATAIDQALSQPSTDFTGTDAAADAAAAAR